MIHFKEFNKEKEYIAINTDGVIRLCNGGMKFTFEEWKTLAEVYEKLVRKNSIVVAPNEL